MQGNDNTEELLGAYRSMDDDTATRYLAMGQMLAEQFPKLATIELVSTRPNTQLDSLKQIGELAPSGMCILRWSDRKITWTNNVYRQYFVDLDKRDVNIGVAIDEILPEFKLSGLEEIFEKVAKTGQPFMANNFPVTLMTGEITYWDWSLAPLPFTEHLGGKLLVQMQRVTAPKLTLAA